jgi:hypothetical protein
MRKMRKMRGMRGMRGMRKMRKRLLILNFEFCEKLPGGASAAGGFPDSRRLALVSLRSKLFKTNFDF